MFGYIKPHIPELFVREYEFYRAAYCGLCRSMRTNTGAISTLTLNYDMVFLALVRIIQTKDTCRDRMRRCIAHPLKKKPMLESCKSLDYSARVSALLTYANLCDDIADGNFFKRLTCRFAKPVLAHAKQKAGLSDLYDEISTHLSSLAMLEERRCTSVDEPSDCFGRLLGAVFSYGVREIEHPTAEAIGYHLGRFIYALDAAEDYEKDLASGNYNPFVCLFGASELSEQMKRGIYDAMMLELKYLEDAVSELDFTGYATIEGIIKNIVCLGLRGKLSFLLPRDQGCNKDNENITGGSDERSV